MYQITSGMSNWYTNYKIMISLTDLTRIERISSTMEWLLMQDYLHVSTYNLPMTLVYAIYKLMLLIVGTCSQAWEKCTEMHQISSIQHPSSHCNEALPACYAWTYPICSQDHDEIVRLLNLAFLEHEEIVVDSNRTKPGILFLSSYYILYSLIGN